MAVLFPTDLQRQQPSDEQVVLAAGNDNIAHNMRVGDLVNYVRENVPLETLIETNSSQQQTIETMAQTAEGKDATIAQLTVNKTLLRLSRLRALRRLRPTRSLRWQTMCARLCRKQ